MAKHYGVTCDRCKKEVPAPSFHCILKIAQFLSRDTVKYDLCHPCQKLVEDFIGKYSERREIA
jgi:hypothetical protein